MSKRKSLTYGFMFGSTISGIIALLNAPTSGRELRSSIKKKNLHFKETLYDLKNSGSALSTQVKHAIKDSSSTVKGFSDDIETSIEKWKTDTLPHRQNIEAALTDIEKTMKRLEEELPKSKE